MKMGLTLLVIVIFVSPALAYDPLYLQIREARGKLREAQMVFEKCVADNPTSPIVCVDQDIRAQWQAKAQAGLDALAAKQER